MGRLAQNAQQSWHCRKGCPKNVYGSKNHTAFAAAARVLAVFWLEPFHAICLSWRASRTGATHCLLFVVSSDLPHKVAERLIDIDALLSRRLDEATAEAFGKFAALYNRIVGQITGTVPRH